LERNENTISTKQNKRKEKKLANPFGLNEGRNTRTSAVQTSKTPAPGNTMEQKQ
jgi:hypothetical protein